MAIFPQSSCVLEGYRHGLEDPAYLPPGPAVVTRLRAGGGSPEAFLAWADSLMQPLAPGERAQLDWAKLETCAAKSNPALTPAFLRIKKLGWLRLGIGSALAGSSSRGLGVLGPR
jgi:hypothetical protein